MSTTHHRTAARLGRSMLGIALAGLVPGAALSGEGHMPDASAIDLLLQSSWALAGMAFALVFLLTIGIGLAVVRLYENHAETDEHGMPIKKRPTRWNQQPSDMRVKRRIRDVRQHAAPARGPSMHDMQG